MNIRFYLLRHCQASGQEPDATLTAEGVNQAKSIVSQLTTLSIDGIISSSYLRAIETVTPFSTAAALMVQTDQRLCERILTTEEMPDWRENLEATFRDPTLKFTGGESSKEAAHRMTECVDMWTKKFQHPVFVSHGNIITLYLQTLDPSVGFEHWKRMRNPELIEVSRVGKNFKLLWQDLY